MSRGRTRDNRIPHQPRPITVFVYPDGSMLSRTDLTTRGILVDLDDAVDLQASEDGMLTAHAIKGLEGAFTFRYVTGESDLETRKGFHLPWRRKKND